ncbi:hypothetical protein RGQ29_031702 [Quercus rubra]|uniref:Leucine-rich repeat-containing N-terminal plant-type domain-containing protein n=1 Tax=Quercus rubra TaxID=3512 RepID=A0AAN7EL15_QUERU|nr:hypothetical protein RGQ29_031702 [Quercus rubra]
MNQFLPLLLASCLFFISHSQITFNTSSQHACFPDQSSALLQLRQEFIEKRISFDHVRYFDHFDYINYYNISYPKMKFWKSDIDCCSWDGVTCNAENGQMIGLNLSNSWLCGSLDQIPSKILWLSNLVSLDLSFNYDFLGYFYLNFKVIDLETFVQNITNLRELHLDKVEFLSSLPHSLTNFSSLTSLSLLDCHITSCSLSLKQLHLSFTNFYEELPNSIGNLKFSWAIPSETSRISDLSFLGLSYNSLTRAIPLVLYTMPSLFEISFYQNQLSSLLKFQNLSSSPLEALKLSGNKLNGPIPRGKIPKWCWNVGKDTLQYLNLSFNLLSSFEQPPVLPRKKLQTHFIPPLSTVYLFASKNKMTGNISPMICKLNHLQVLDLSNNQFIGHNPECIEVLNIAKIKLNNTFPFWLESLPELQILVLRENGFYGPIWDPHTKFSFFKLRVICLSQNSFSSKLPTEYFKTWNAMLMDLGKNKSQFEYMGIKSIYYKDSLTIVVKGREMELIASVGNLKGIIVLNLSNNSFMSHILSSLGNLILLESLALSQNGLSGRIPQQLTSLTFLEYLNLSQNQLIGPIPQGGQFSTFQGSSFEGNLGLCGFQLLKECENNETPTSQLSHESSFGEGFNWKVVVIGYACGLVI